MDTAHFAPVYGSALHKHLNRRGKSAKDLWKARMLDKDAEQAWIDGEAERPYQVRVVLSCTDAACYERYGGVR